uniref:G_PROTEIN_RECEP_F1_2 domain-containing protein n=1 Tax=Panagrellus redivivus TaxID=6233 RepID=A0A7E4ZTA5_PANRE
MDNKCTLSMVVLFIVTFHMLIAGAIYLSSTNVETSKDLALNETGHSLLKYFNEPSFYYAGENGGKTRSIGKIVVFMIGCALVPFVTCIIVFIVHVVHNAKSINNHARTARSLVIVVLVQALLCVNMIMIPSLWIMVSWAWNIEHSLELTNYFMTLLSLHGIADAICTIYCVMPYRRYVVSLFTRKKIVKVNHVSNTSQPTNC